MNTEYIVEFIIKKVFLVLFLLRPCPYSLRITVSRYTKPNVMISQCKLLTVVNRHLLCMFLKWKATKNCETLLF